MSEYDKEAITGISDNNKSITQPSTTAVPPPKADAIPAAVKPPLALDSDDAAWFKLFALLEKYGKPGMLDEAFAETPTEAAAAADVSNSGQESNTIADAEEDESEKRAQLITVRAIIEYFKLPQVTLSPGLNHCFVCIG